MSFEFTDAEQLKFQLLAEGLTITDKALQHIAVYNGDRPLTPADYASTSGLILELEDDVWVNAPVAEHNANFVNAPPFQLTADGNGLMVEGKRLASPARLWLQPAWHGARNAAGEEYNSYAFTHCDRVRVSPIEGCAITCRFCDLPYEFRYRTKRIEGVVDAVRVAAEDPIQPARHILISGGTPRQQDYGYVQEAYATILTTFPELPTDIMMVPMSGLLDVAALADLGVAGLSINIEVYNREVARRVMRRKYDQGLEHYQEFLEHAAGVLGGSRVRSMLMVGIEPREDTLKGVEAIARRGCVPVLSPFRPDPSTPMRDVQPPPAELLQDVYLRAWEITQRYEVDLGPSCIPCAHNTLTLSRATGHGSARIAHGSPTLI